MALENALVYNFTSGDNTYPHSGNFTVGVAGKITIDDSNGTDDAIFGDVTHTGGADTPDQDVTSSTVAGINLGDTVDLRYKYTITGSDGSSGTIYFIATNGAANYGPLFVSDFQLDPGVTYTFGTFNTDGAAPYSSLVPCFTTGAQLSTPAGSTAVEDLKPNDLLLTRDHGPQRIRWIGKAKRAALGENTPIRICLGALGMGLPTRDLIVSQQHRMLVSSAIARRVAGAQEVLIPAKKLLGLPGIDHADDMITVTYYHLLLDHHEIIFAEGAPTESLLTGPMARQAMGANALAEIQSLFPELLYSAGDPARVIPRGKQMRELVSRHRKNAQPLLQA
ncbi:Hint domain-containing protein [Litoreibacter meonggei]|uniref:Hint domain-containing protein n=1 Tax=Litoreibacter meonggei TaxID=1049199 RepID=A0A497VKL7_9RHOB|nr:Hint domain-containing protein [Litoreibacter meonggei]RLJ40765.1 Hint domain-containing protein [Litoreibacter meonggei]